MSMDLYLEQEKKQLNIELAQEQQAEEAGRKREETIRQVSCLVGRSQAFGYMAAFTGMAELATLKEVKDQKLYREFGAPTWAGFCELFGINYKTIDERLLNLEKFGLAFMEATQKIGLSRQDLRRLQALPVDARADAINQTVNLENPTKEQVRDLLDKMDDMESDNALLKDKVKKVEAKLDKKESAIVRGQDQITEMEDKLRALQKAQENSLIRGDEQKSLEVLSAAKRSFNNMLLSLNAIELESASPAIKASMVAFLEYVNRMLKQTFLDICQQHPEIDMQDILDIPGFQDANPWNHVAVSPADDAALKADGTVRPINTGAQNQERQRASAGGR